MTKTILLAFCVALAFGGVSQAFALPHQDSPVCPQGKHEDSDGNCVFPSTEQ